MIDLLYVSFNRLEMTRESFQSLIDNTEWAEVARLHVVDDGSVDGTKEWLREAVKEAPTDGRFYGHRRPRGIGGPVAAMNVLLDNLSEGVEQFAKIDNDMVVPPGWLTDLLATMTRNPGLDVLGMEPFVGDPTASPFRREVTPAVHVGGKGLIRTRVFSHCRPRPGGRNGYYGWTEFQTKHRDITKGWATPDLLAFGLDQLGFEPWASLVDRYEAKRWARRWPPYSDPFAYCSWWAPVHMPVSA